MAYPTDQELQDAKTDIDNLEAFANDTGTVTLRSPATTIKTMRQFATDFDSEVSNAQAWASETDAPVITSPSNEYSSKEYAQGSQAGTGGSAKNWAQETGGDVTGASANSKSAKAWAQSDLTGATLGGSAKDWAQTSGSTVDGSEYSAKSYAQDDLTGSAGGSAKDWSTTAEDTEVAGGEFSAKHYAAKAQASLDAFEAIYLGAQSSDPSVDGNGDPVTAGDWYYNTASGKVRIYSGSGWGDAIDGISDAFSGTMTGDIVVEGDWSFTGGSSYNGLRIVESCASLASLSTSGISNGDTFLVRGFASVNDGGGGRFYYTTADISAGVDADGLNGAFIPDTADATGASGGFIRDTQRLTARMFGGFGDATTSCVAPIQAMVNVAYVYNAVVGGSTSVTTTSGGIGSLECGVDGHLLMDGSSTIDIPEGVSIQGTGGQQARYVNTTREGTVFLVTNTTTPVFTYVRALTISDFGVFYPDQTDANCSDYTAAADALGGPISYPFFASRGSNNGARFKAANIEIYNGFNGFEVGPGALFENCRTFCVNNEITVFDANAAVLIHGAFMSAAHQRWIDATDAGSAGNLSDWRHYNGTALIVQGVADGLTFSSSLIFRVKTLVKYENTSDSAVTQTNQNFQKFADITIDGLRKVIEFDEGGSRGAIGVFELSFDNCYFGLDDANNTASYTGADELAIDLNFTGYDGGATGIGGATQGDADQTIRFTDCRWKNLIGSGIRVASGCSLDRLIIDGGEVTGLAVKGSSTTAPAYFVQCNESTCDVEVKNLRANASVGTLNPLVDTTIFDFADANNVTFVGNTVNGTHDSGNTSYGVDLGDIDSVVIDACLIDGADSDLRISGTVANFKKGVSNYIETDDTDTDIAVTGLTVSGGAAFNTDTLVVDDANGRVGFNIAAPQYEMHIKGDVGFEEPGAGTQRWTGSVLGSANFQFSAAGSGSSELQITPTTGHLIPNGDLQLKSGSSVSVDGDTIIDGSGNISAVDIAMTGATSCPRTELTIASGSVTPTRRFHVIDTEGDASTDDLDTIVAGDDGQELIIAPVNSSRDVVVKHGTGNILLNGATDYTMSTNKVTLHLIYHAGVSSWLEVGRGNNA